MFHRTIYSIENKFQIFCLLPMDNRKIKHPFSPLPLLCAYSFFFLLRFFFSFHVSIYFGTYKIPPVSGNFHLFSAFKWQMKISPDQPKFLPEPRSHVQTFSVPLLFTFILFYFSLENIEFSSFFCSQPSQLSPNISKC